MGRSSSGASYRGWSFGGGGCLAYLFGWILIVGVVGGMVVAGVAWPLFVVPGWPRWLAWAAWLLVILALGFRRAYRKAGSHERRPSGKPGRHRAEAAPVKAAPGPRDWTPRAGFTGDPSRGRA